MTKDMRYEVAKVMIKEGEIRSFAELFKYIPKTVVARDLGLNVTRFVGLIGHPEKFRVRDIYAIAELCNLEPYQVFELIDKQMKMNKKEK